MLDVSLIRVASIGDLKSGDLFHPLSGNRRDRYLVGAVNSTPVMLSVGGEHPFFIYQPDQIPRQRGFALGNLRFEVDRTSAAERHSEDDTPIGELVCFAGGFGMCGHDRFDAHLVAVQGELRSEQNEIVRLVSFGSWRIGVESAGEWHVVFERKATAS